MSNCWSRKKAGKTQFRHSVEGRLSQLNIPLLWEEAVKVMKDKGVDNTIESGPETLLSGHIRRIDVSSIRILNVEDTKSLDSTLSSLP